MSKNVYATKSRFRPRSKSSAATIVAAALLLLLSACGGGDGTAASGGSEPGVDKATKRVKLGGWTIASGAFAGQAAAGRGVEVCISSANAAGGVNGWKFDLTLNDTGGEPTRALQETRDQIDGGKVFAMVWAPGTSSNVPALPYALGKSMPYQPGMSGDSLLGKDLKNVFPMIPAYSQLGYHMADYAVKDLGAKRVAVIYEKSGIGQDVGSTIGKYLKSIGAELVASVPTAPEDSDFTPMGIALTKSKPDVVIAQAGPTALVKTKANMMANGTNVPWISGYIVASDAVVGLDPATMDGTYFNSYLAPFFSDMPAAVKFREDMKNYGKGSPPDIQSINGYASCQIFLEGFKAMTANGSSPTQKGLIDAFESFGTKPIGVNGAITYTPEKHLGNSAAYIIQWKDKKWSTIKDVVPLPSGS